MMKAPLDCLSYSLNEAIHNPIVSDIHIIDNSNSDLFDKNIKIQSDRIHIHKMKENIYVNPAWNFGVSLCRSPLVIIMNDDLYVNGMAYTNIHALMQDSLIGLSSIETINVYNIESYLKIIDKFDKTLITNDVFGFNDRHNINMSGWFFCIQRKLWKNIPNQMKIFFGDNLTYSRIRNLGYKTKNITNIKIAHVEHSTVNRKRGYIKNRYYIVKKDKAEYAKIKNQFILD